MKSINPATGELIHDYPAHSQEQIAAIIENAQGCYLQWKLEPFAHRATLMREAAQVLRKHKTKLAGLMADEMGKVLKEGEGEIEKCASVCDYYAEHAEAFLADENIKTEAQKVT